MKDSVAQCRYLLLHSDAVFRDLDDSHLAIEPQPGAKTAGWLIGHLAVTGDFGRRLCARPPICPAEWRPLFNPGSQPSTRRETYPSMNALHDAFREVYLDLCTSALNAEPSVLAKENPFTPTRPAFPTSGDFVAYLLAGHLAYHLGQLVAWRAAAGLGKLSDASLG